MGKVRKEIEKIQIDETLSLTEVFKKYPHLETLQFLELKEENESSKIKKLSDNKKLLLD
tara:strand:+ start:724 stop:900 length:177 start_codon:yes stop_codon:yes gene_type:complete